MDNKYSPDDNSTPKQPNSAQPETTQPETSAAVSTPESEVSAVESETSAKSTPATVPEAVVGGEVSQKQPGKIAIITIAVAFLLVVGAIVWAITQSSTEPELDFSLPGSSGETVEPIDFASLPEVVAEVNGVEISRADYEEAFTQAANIATQQGFDPNTTGVQQQLETQAFERLINTELLAQAAADAGVAASPEEIAAEIATLEENFGGAEAFAAELEAAGLTREQLELDIATQLQIDAFIAASPEWSEDMTVSAEEKQALYDEVAAQNTDLPPFAEVESQIESQLLSEKQQAATQALIERLESEATIENFLPTE